MGYAELVKALEEETERSARTLVEAGEREAARLLDEAARTGRALEIEARARAARDRTTAEDRRQATTRRTEERQALLAMRRLLDELFADAESRLLAAPDLDLTERLLAELAPELAGQRGTLEVAPAHLDAVRRQAPPGFVVAPGASGILARLEGGLVLDDRLASRLARARAALEPELARLLFGEDHAGN